MKLEKLIRPDLLDLKPYSSARDEYKGKEGIFLDANENPFENGMNRYPDPLQLELKEKVAELKSVLPEQVFFGNGSDECIDLLIRLFCIPGLDSVLSISPSYGMYSISAKINQIKLIEVSLNDDFSLNNERLIQDGKNSKLMFICSPNNPSGNAFPKNEIVYLLENFEGLVVVDEAYVDFSSEGSMLTELKNYPNLVVLQTFSKAYGMAGLRLGMLFGSRELIQWLNKIKPPYNINQLTQNEVLKSIKDTGLVQSQIKILVAERERVVKMLSGMDIVQTIYKSDANFILIKVNNADEVYNSLINNKIIVRNRSNQPLCENCIRITIGTAEENNQMLKKMNELVIKKEIA